MHTRLVGICLVVILTPVASRAETPLGTAFTYQGQLKDAGVPANGNFNMVLKLFDALTLGNQVGPTLSFDGAGGNPPSVSVTDGLFTVPIDFGSTAFGGSKRWLSITVSGMTLTPRQELTAAPYARYAQSVPLPLTLTGTSSTHVIRGENASTGFLPTAIYGLCTGASGGSTGVRGESASTNGRGVVGFATAATGTTYGGQFESTSTSGTGVWGVASATSGSASGGRFESDSTAGRGVYGEATAVTGGTYGGRFQTASVSGYGVFGWATATTGTNFGVFGRSDSPDGYAGYFTGGRNYFDGSVGIGTNDPHGNLHVVGGTDSEPGSGGYIVAGLTTSTNVAIDNNEIMARNNGVASTLALNADGGNVNLIQSGTGNVGIGTSNPGAKLDVNGAARVDSLEVSGGAIRVLGAGENTNTAAFIHVATETGNETVIDHPSCNGNPSAMIFVTARQTCTPPCSPYLSGPINVRYFTIVGEELWRIRADDGDIVPGQEFNVLVVLP